MCRYFEFSISTKSLFVENRFLKKQNLLIFRRKKIAILLFEIEIVIMSTKKTRIIIYDIIRTI